MEFASNATGYRQSTLYWNDATIVALFNQAAVNGVSTFTQVMGVKDFSQWDFLELYARQTSGGALNIQTGSDFTPVFYAEKIG